MNILNNLEFQICFWATFSSDRGQADLVVGAAFSFAVRMQPECRVVVFGDGPSAQLPEDVQELLWGQNRFGWRCHSFIT